MQIYIFMNAINEIAPNMFVLLYIFLYIQVLYKFINICSLYIITVLVSYSTILLI